MSKFLGRAVHAALTILGGVALLTGCAVPEVTDLVQLGSPRIALQTAPPRSVEGGVTLHVGKAPPLPLPDHVSAQIEGAWAMGADRLVLVQGATKQCQVQQTLVMVRGERAELRPLGRCDERFAITWNGELLSARQIGARDAAIWRFRDGALSGPVMESSLNGRRGRGTAAADGAEPPAPTQPIQVPPVSRPVGEDVIPPPVGGGPLPRQRQPDAPPRLF